MNAHIRGTRLPLISSCVSLASRRGLRSFPDRSRITTFGRLFEGTDEISLGQTWPGSGETVDNSHSSHVVAEAANQLAMNVAERLAPAQKTVSFCQCRFDNEMATDNEVRMPTKSRAHRPQYRCDEPRPAASSPVDNRTTTAVLSPQPVDNYVDSSSSFVWSSLQRPRGGTRH